MARNYSRIANFVSAQYNDQPGALGGYIIKIAAGATLQVGQVVKIDPSGAGEVIQGAAQTDTECIGVVVGGDLTDGVIMWGAQNVGVTACSASGGYVLVALQGSMVWAKKVNGTVITAGLGLVPEASGSLGPGTTPLAGEYLATAVIAPADSDTKVLVLIQKH